MAKITLLQSVAGITPTGDTFGYAAGDTVDVEDAVAKDLVGAGYAERVGGKTTTSKREKRTVSAAETR
jgi:hypothetical protein